MFVRVFQSRKSGGLVSRRDRDWNGVGLVVMALVVEWVMMIWVNDSMMAWVHLPQLTGTLATWTKTESILTT